MSPTGSHRSSPSAPTSSASSPAARVVRYSFPVINRTEFEVRIVNWKTKCGCTNVRVGSKVIPPGTQTTIEATIDTTRFQGPKASGLTLFLDRPAVTEVDLNMNCFIRTDITMAPGLIDFGVVRPSEKPPTAALTLNYAGGRPGWEIADMKTQTAKVKAVAKELGRSADGRIQWHVTATLEPGLPNGYFKDEIILITNDSPPQTIPISVVANVQSAVSVSPSIINFGALKPGQSVSKVGARPLGVSVCDHQALRQRARSGSRRGKARIGLGPHGQYHAQGPRLLRPVPRRPQGRKRLEGRTASPDQDVCNHCRVALSRPGLTDKLGGCSGRSPTSQPSVGHDRRLTIEPISVIDRSAPNG